MSHPAPVVISILVPGGRLYYSQDDCFNGLTVEAAWPFFDEQAALAFCIHADADLFEIEYLHAAVAREDREYAAQLADLRG